MIRHSELTVNQNAYVLDRSWELQYRAVPQRQRLWQSLIQLMPCAKPNDLRLVFIKLQAITGHPIANAFKAAGEAFNCFLARGRWYTDVQLCIVCIRVAGETELETQCQTIQTCTARTAVGLKQTIVVLQRGTCHQQERRDKVECTRLCRQCCD